MKRLLVTILLSLACFAANAEWTTLIRGVDDNDSVDIDRSTFKRDAGVVKLWTRWDYVLTSILIARNIVRLSP